MYKVDTKTLEKITKVLDKVASQDISSQKENLDEAYKLSQYIKDNYTQIKPQ